MAAAATPSTSSRRSSWMNNYDNVELEVPEADGLLQARSKAFTPSPLNPTSPPVTPSVARSATTSSNGLTASTSPSPPPRFVRSSSSTTNLVGSRMPSEESRILSSATGGRGSMILYHLPVDGPLSPPPNMNRLTMMSTNSRDSTISYSDDSKYPGTPNEHGVQPYLYDPEVDGGTFDKEDLEALQADKSHFSLRGTINVVALIVILGALIGLFVIYPVTSLGKVDIRHGRIMGNRYINETGQATGF